MVTIHLLFRSQSIQLIQQLSDSVFFLEIAQHLRLFRLEYA